MDIGKGLILWEVPYLYFESGPCMESPFWDGLLSLAFLLILPPTSDYFSLGVLQNLGISSNNM